MKSRVLSVLCLCLLVSLLSPVFDASAGEPEKISIGEIHKIQSKVLGEERSLLVGLPFRYNLYKESYPVFYLLDGQEHFSHIAGLIRFLGTRGIIPEMIVVGVVNTDRGRDFTPTRVEKKSGGYVKNSGGADKFIGFMQKELFPYVKKTFRTRPYRVLAGHSLCGMFATFVMLHHPGMFQAHLAISPFLDWDKKVVLRGASAALSKLGNKRGFFYASYAGGDDHTLKIDSDVLALQKLIEKQAPKNLTWQVKALNDENHASTVHLAIYQGLTAVYAGWRPSLDSDLASLQAHYRNLTARYGYEIKVPEGVVNLLGYRALGKDKKKAIEIFENNVKMHPDSANVYDSLGEALEKDGQLKKALTNYRKAVQKMGRLPKYDKRVMAVYRQNLDRVEKMLGEKK